MKRPAKTTGGSWSIGGTTASLFVLTLVTVCCVSRSSPPTEPRDTILTGNVVELKETVSPEGFVHPGIGCSAATLAVMREKVIAGVSPWVDYFEGLRRVRYGNLRERPRLVPRITNNGGIAQFTHDSQLAWGHTVLYVVTGNEAYRKTPVEIIRWYGSRTNESFFPHGFADSHIKIGKPVFILCAAADILRSTRPVDPDLAVTKAMIGDLQTNCMMPIRKNSIEHNGYFMNQHTYAIIGYLASAILGDEAGSYRQVVEWTTVNATAPNQGHNGSIKQQIRMVTRNDKTGEPVAPRLQLVEMGRDQPHAEGNVNSLLTLVKTLGFQRTKVDPVAGTVTTNADGVAPIHFLDDRLIKGATLFARYNLGYGLPWVPTYSEKDSGGAVTYDQISYYGRGAALGGASGIPAGYFTYRGYGFDLDLWPYRFIKMAMEVSDTAREYAARSGIYIDQLHNYAFDFWIGLPAAASDAAPDPVKAGRALATTLPPLVVSRDGVPVEGEPFEFRHVDLSARARPGDIFPGSLSDPPLRVRRDTDGTGYVRATLKRQPRSFAVFLHITPGSGLRVRSDAPVKLEFYRDHDYGRCGPLQTLYVPDTRSEWNDVIATFGSGALCYIAATPLAGSAVIDFDRVDSAAALRPPAFEGVGDTVAIPTYIGAHLGRTFAATGGVAAVTYGVSALPAGATLDSSTGTLSWTPSAKQAGDHMLLVTARAGDVLRALRVDVHVARDLQSALDAVARAYDPTRAYESAPLQVFKAALAARDLAALKTAADGLAPLNPHLPDGSLDYRRTCDTREHGVANMADGDVMSWGGLWGGDKSITLDFGSRFKVRSESFRIQARDGFPIRVAQAVVYGSNDQKQWNLLTETPAVSSPELQTLTVKPEERTRTYRYLRFFMPARAYPIFEIAEMRIFGERIEAQQAPPPG